jgi:hypothetical protein
MVAILGHEKGIKQWHSAMELGRLPHATILFGTRGIGKAATALSFAQTLLEANSSGLKQMVENGTHPDIHLLRAADGKGIKIEEVRAMLEFTCKTAGLAKRKVVVIDAIDEMSRNAVNALLKVLEEPGEETYFLIVCHRAKGLPVTIRSRCAILRFPTPALESFGEALALHGASYEGVELRNLYIATAGSIGIAIRVLEEGLWSGICKLMEAIRTGVGGLAGALEICELMTQQHGQSLFHEIRDNLEAEHLKAMVLSGASIDIDQWFYNKDIGAKMMSEHEVLHFEASAVELQYIALREDVGGSH